MAKDNSTASIPPLDEDFSLVSGGLIYILMTSIPGLKDGKNAIQKRAALFALLTWLPLLIFALMAGTFTGDAVEINFLEDFPIHIRFLFVVPFLILIEKGIDKAFVLYIKTTQQLIAPGHAARFKRIVSNVDRASNSFIPEIIILIVIYLVIINNWSNLDVFQNTREFLIQKDTEKLSPAGWCFLLFSFPIYQLLVFRWIWRWILWTYSVVAFSRFPFPISALHYDQMAGLSYLNLPPFMFSNVFIAFSALLASRIGFYIIFDGATLTAYLLDILVYIVTVPLLLFGPLLFYTPMLMEAKAKGVRYFGQLITKHNTDYINKWIKSPQPEKEPILGAADNSSLCDINTSYGPVNDLKIIPWDFKMLGATMAFTLLPFVPLIFTFYSINEILTKLFNTLLGV